MKCECLYEYTLKDYLEWKARISAEHKETMLKLIIEEIDNKETLQ